MNCPPFESKGSSEQAQSGFKARLRKVATGIGSFVRGWFSEDTESCPPPPRYSAYNPYDTERLLQAREQVEELARITGVINRAAPRTSILDFRCRHVFAGDKSANPLNARMVSLLDPEAGSTLPASARVYDREIAPNGRLAVRCQTFTPDYTDGVTLTTQFGANVNNTFVPFDYPEAVQTRQASPEDFISLRGAVRQTFGLN